MTNTARLHLGTVLVLTSSYPKMKGEPSGVFLHHLGKELVKLGWRVLVLAPNFPRGESSEEMEGVRITRFNYFVPSAQLLCYRSGMIPNLRKSPWLWIEVPFFFASLLFHAVKLVRSEPISLIHAHWIFPQGIVARCLQKMFKIPIILTVHGSDLFVFSGRMGRALKRAVLRGIELCTANSSFTQQSLLDFRPRLPICLVPMGVDADLFHPERTNVALRRQLQIDGEMILYVGRLIERKGTRHLLQAMPAVLKNFPDAVLVLVGIGHYRDELERLAKQLGIHPAVRFEGHISQLELPGYYATADLFVAPSLEEGLGIVFMEASASQLAMIGTDVGGIPDILIDGVTGVRVNPGDPAELAEAMKTLLENHKLRADLALKAREHVLENFSWAQVAGKFSSLFQKIIQRKLDLHS